MKSSFCEYLICPRCKSELSQTEESLDCTNCRANYPIINGIPRFVPESNYTDSFGFEWTLYGSVQVDSLSGNSISRDRFRATTDWEPNSMKGKLILDCGCGGGRFAEQALATGATVVAFDYSAAIDVAKQNLGDNERLHLAQVSILEMPFRPVFDAVYCLGVLQHTPDPRHSMKCLASIVKPGGQLIVDVYEKKENRGFGWWFSPQRLVWRPLLRQVPHATLLKLIKIYIRLFWRLDSIVEKRVAKGGVIGNMLWYFRMFFPMISNYTVKLPFLTEEQLRLWAEMNTLDTYSPKYTNMQSRKQMRSYAEESNLEQIELFCKPDDGDGGPLVLRARKPADVV